MISTKSFLELQTEHSDGYFGERCFTQTVHHYRSQWMILPSHPDHSHSSCSGQAAEEEEDDQWEHWHKSWLWLQSRWVEYEESALKDANLDYDYSVDDPEYMETGVTLTIIVALMKMRTTKMKNQMGRKSNQCWHAKKLTCFLLFQ